MARKFSPSDGSPPTLGFREEESIHATTAGANKHDEGKEIQRQRALSRYRQGVPVTGEASATTKLGFDGWKNWERKKFGACNAPSLFSATFAQIFSISYQLSNSTILLLYTARTHLHGTYFYYFYMHSLKIIMATYRLTRVRMQKYMEELHSQD
ncbi:expressed protein [Arabidopsis lyrata subsp. lyrata]|uniref:Expressed protein n=1 Tax=Arabidopsis lyrata subsp. lyrata TaxID=81972 RepID=D7L6U0_ARALL|nr:expressed protein [Arabidopsis lyrata subsp. lyrata]